MSNRNQSPEHLIESNEERSSIPVASALASFSQFQNDKSEAQQ